LGQCCDAPGAAPWNCLQVRTKSLDRAGLSTPFWNRFPQVTVKLLLLCVVCGVCVCVCAYVCV
jgi:hypothetical protein